MITLRCCVVDDEPIARELIAGYIEKTPFMELVGKFGSAQEAVKTIMEGHVDVIYLDIHMPQLNGMEFARIVPDTCRIVFITAYERYALEGFKVDALDYLMKPVSYGEFVESANKAMKWADLRRRADENDNRRKYMIVKSEYKLVQIPMESIIYVEGLKDYIKIYLDNEASPVMTLMNMKTVESYLPAADFMRVHRSYIVNIKKIKVIERNHIIIGGRSIPVSESYRKAFGEYIEAYMLNM